MKKAFLPFVAIISLTGFALADEASHKAAAEEMLDINKVPEVMEKSFLTVMEPNFQAMKAGGMPEEGVKEMRDAVTKWYGETLKWDVMKPKFVELYVQEFTEAELKEIVAFYKTPVGQKALDKMPDLMQKGSVIGQDLAQANQQALGAEMQRIIAKYKPAGAPGAP
jgi:hypothetical protein